MPGAPEGKLVFRVAQLTLLLEIAAEQGVSLPTIDRLGYYDFFAAHPFVVVAGETRHDRADQLTLRLAGWSEQQLSYASIGQRFVDRRRQLPGDVSLLLAYGIAQLHGSAFVLTTSGNSFAERLGSVYADAYRVASRIVLRRLRRLSERRLRENAQRWLAGPGLLLDVFDDVAEIRPRVPRTKREAPS